MKLWKRLRWWWYRRCRALDLRIVWPQICAHAPSIEHARAAFAAHVLLDPAWQVLDTSSVLAFINRLEEPNKRSTARVVSLS